METIDTPKIKNVAVDERSESGLLITLMVVEILKGLSHGDGSDFRVLVNEVKKLRSSEICKIRQQ